MITTIFDQSYLLDLIRFQANTYTGKHIHKTYDTSITNQINKPDVIVNIKTPVKNNCNRKGRI